MKFLTLNEEQVAVGDIKNKHTRVEHIWTREDFEIKFAVSIPANLIGLSYEPERDLYIVNTDRMDNVQSYGNPEEHPLLNWVNQNFDAIIREAIAELLPNHVYNSDEDRWEIPAAVQDELDREARQNQRITQLREAVVDQFDFIRELFQVGVSKGHWAAGDFSVDLRQKFQEWSDLIDAYRGDTS